MNVYKYTGIVTKIKAWIGRMKPQTAPRSLGSPQLSNTGGCNTDTAHVENRQPLFRSRKLQGGGRGFSRDFFFADLFLRSSIFTWLFFFLDGPPPPPLGSHAILS